MDKKTIKLKIDKERCKGCLFCVSMCPRRALEMSTEVNDKGLQYVILKCPDKCNGCGMCALVCPDTAIEIEGDKK